MPKTIEELAAMLAKRDGLTFEEEMCAISDCAHALEGAFVEGNLNEAETILQDYLNLEPDFLDIFIF